MTVPSARGRDAAAIVAAARAEISRVVESARRDLRELGDLSAVDRLDDLAREADAQLDRVPPGTPVRGATASVEASAALRRELAVWDAERLAGPMDLSAFPPETPPSRPRRVPLIAALVAAACVVVASVLWFGRSEANPTSVATAVEPSPAPSAEPSAAPQPAAQGSEAAVVPAAAPLTIRWEAQRTAWIQMTIDGDGEPGALYERGTTRTIEAQREIRLRIGDAGAVLVSVNNEPAAALGPDGQVVDRRFTSER